MFEKEKPWQENEKSKTYFSLQPRYRVLLDKILLWRSTERTIIPSEENRDGFYTFRVLFDEFFKRKFHVGDKVDDYHIQYESIKPMGISALTIFYIEDPSNKGLTIWEILSKLEEGKNWIILNRSGDIEECKGKVRNWTVSMLEKETLKRLASAHLITRSKKGKCALTLGGQKFRGKVQELKKKDPKIFINE